jgi:hypothetical protein
MKPTPWYRVPEVWLVIFLLAGGVFAGVSIAVVAMHQPDAHIANADTQGEMVGH